MTAVASTVEGRRGGPLTEAAERLDKAARARYARVVKATSRSHELQVMARLVRLMGHISGDEDTADTCLRRHVAMIAGTHREFTSAPAAASR